MAFLLGWISLDGRPLDHRLWTRLVGRARGRTLHAGSEVDLGHARLYGAVQRPQEPAPLSRIRLAPDAWGYRLCDSAEGDSGDWNAREPLMEAEGPAGSGVTVWVTESRQRVYLQRDLGGQRALHYAAVDGTLLFATGATVLLAHPRISGGLREESIAAYLAGAPPPEQASMFRDIDALAPGGQLEVREGRISHRRFRLRPDESWRALRDHDIVEKTHALIQDAVVRACKGASRIGVLLSAGLDSSSVAAIAARHTPALTAVTYGFDDWPELDERRDVSAFARSLEIGLRAFAADHHGPFAEPDSVVANPDFPCTTPFRRMADLAMDELHRAGACLFLDGNLADHLHAEPREAWSDAVRMRRAGPFLAELRRVLRVHGAGVALRHPGWRRLAARLLRRSQAQALLGQRLREPWRRQLRERLVAGQSMYRDFPRPEQAAFAMDGTAANIVPREQFHAARKGMELRSPFRDRRLMAWMLSLPADFSYRDGHAKWIQRASMRDQLPHEVCWRPKTLSPQAFFAESMRSSEETTRKLCAAAREWLDAFIDDGAAIVPVLQPLALWLDAELGLWLSTSDPADWVDETWRGMATG